MLTSPAGQTVHDFSSIEWSLAFGILAAVIYIFLMLHRHRKSPATGAIGRMFIEVWFLSGIVIVVVRLFLGIPIGTNHEDYVFVVLGLLLGAVICLKHIAAMFHSIYKEKEPGWNPDTENSDE